MASGVNSCGLPLSAGNRLSFTKGGAHRRIVRQRGAAGGVPPPIARVAREGALRTMRLQLREPIEHAVHDRREARASIMRL